MQIELEIFATLNPAVFGSEITEYDSEFNQQNAKCFAE
jgi:hypothetical protein